MYLACIQRLIKINKKMKLFIDKRTLKLKLKKHIFLKLSKRIIKSIILITKLIKKILIKL